MTKKKIQEVKSSLRPHLLTIYTFAGLLKEFFKFKGNALVQQQQTTNKNKQ